MLHAEIGLTLGALELDIALDIADGDVVALLGPNGAGKTTALRAIAGLEPIDRGRIVLGSETLDDPETDTLVAPHRREIGVVFQDHLLFPDMSALDNVAFGLRARGVGTKDARHRAYGWLDRVGLRDVARAKPSALSGGQAQRVALARALVIEPRLLLLDEPLAALDARTRVSVRRELLQHLASFGGARLLVTHDPVDAVVLASKLVIIENGRVSQAGSTAEVTARPRTSYVADLVGLNLVDGVCDGRGDVLTTTGHHLAVAGATPRGRVAVVMRPRSISLSRQEVEGSQRNRWQATVRDVHPDRDRVRVTLDGPVPSTAEITPEAVTDLVLRAGDVVWASVKAVDLEAHPC